MGTMIIKYLQDGKLLEREMTLEEIAEAEKAMQQQIEADKNKPPTIEEEVTSLKQANSELATTVDSILVDVLPSLMGV